MTLGGDPRVNLLALLMTWTVGVLMLVGAALYLIGGPRRVVPVRRVILLAVVVPAVAVLAVALIP